MKLLKLSLTVAAPADPKEARRADAHRAPDGGHLRQRQVLPAGKAKCLDLEDLDEDHGQRAATRTSSAKPGRAGTRSRRRCASTYERYVELANKGAREIGFADTGAMWRSKYDMPPDAFAKEIDRLWEQVQAALRSLHAYVRRKLREKYGDERGPAEGPIPAHLLGNMWAQDWDNIYPLVAPTGRRPRLRPDRRS